MTYGPVYVARYRARQVRRAQWARRVHASAVGAGAATNLGAWWVAGWWVNLVTGVFYLVALAWAWEVDTRRLADQLRFQAAAEAAGRRP